MTAQSWIVKGRPDRNEFHEYLAPGRNGRWHTSAPPKTWQAGDLLFFWEGAPALRVVGLGRLTRLPQKPTPRGTEALFGVRYLTGFLASPVGIAEARSMRALEGATFLKSGPAGTLFPLSLPQARALFARIAARNPEIVSLWSDAAGTVAVAYPDVDEFPTEAPEGRRRLAIHFARERNRALIEAKKQQVLAKSGVLSCEVCGFDFERTFGNLGAGFCEVHHRVPFGGRTSTRITRLKDLAVVCSNCHRIIHRGGGCRSLKAVRAALRPVA